MAPKFETGQNLEKGTSRTTERYAGKEFGLKGFRNYKENDSEEGQNIKIVDKKGDKVAVTTQTDEKTNNRNTDTPKQSSTTKPALTADRKINIELASGPDGLIATLGKPYIIKEDKIIISKELFEKYNGKIKLEYPVDGEPNKKYKVTISRDKDSGEPVIEKSEIVEKRKLLGITLPFFAKKEKTSDIGLNITTANKTVVKNQTIPIKQENTQDNTYVAEFNCEINKEVVDVDSNISENNTFLETKTSIETSKENNSLNSRSTEVQVKSASANLATDPTVKEYLTQIDKYNNLTPTEQETFNKILIRQAEKLNEPGLKKLAINSNSSKETRGKKTTQQDEYVYVEDSLMQRDDEKKLIIQGKINKVGDKINSGRFMISLSYEGRVQFYSSDFEKNSVGIYKYDPQHPAYKDAKTQADSILNSFITAYKASFAEFEKSTK